MDYNKTGYKKENIYYFRKIHARIIYLARPSHLHDINDDSIKLLAHNSNLLSLYQHIISSNNNIETWLSKSLGKPIICNKISASNLDNQ